MLDWDDLRYLLAVHRTGSLIGAGRALSVDKATVSRRIAALELALGVRLFDRKPKGYQLTPYGQRVVATVGEVDQVIGALTAELSEARGDATGRVFLSIPQWFASHVLIAAVPAFRARHPGIDLVVNASSSVLNVAQREVEVGLRNIKPDQASVTARRVGSLGSALYGARDYLKRRGSPATPAALAHHDLVGWDRAVTFVTGFGWLAEAAPVWSSAATTPRCSVTRLLQAWDWRCCRSCWATSGPVSCASIRSVTSARRSGRWLPRSCVARCASVRSSS